MKILDSVHTLLESKALAHPITFNPDGSPQVPEVCNYE